MSTSVCFGIFIKNGLNLTLWYHFINFIVNKLSLTDEIQDEKIFEENN